MPKAAEAFARAAPDPPRSVTASALAGSGAVGVTWNGSTGDTSYRVYYREVSVGSYVAPTTGDCVDPTTTSCPVTGLVPGTTHTMTLTVTVAEEADLPVTGSPLFDLAQIGAGLVLIGLVLAITGRRFRPTRRAASRAG